MKSLLITTINGDKHSLLGDVAAEVYRQFTNCVEWLEWEKTNNNGRSVQSINVTYVVSVQYGEAK